ncbi:MAG: RluA family pseudouridine synthase [bacterium]|jgi:23S rRNA pseudouridine955/2504/2580 synthase/23S rRNA pseudouridine1911/1915/1917 synthase|nr:RluA family pseudouridine synthase [bacterium]
MKNQFDILFEDEHLIALNKPSHLLVIPDRWDANKPSLFAMLQARNPEHKIFVVHRLDQDTSGVVLFAKSAAAHKHLNQQMEHREVEKVYFAIVTGEVKADGKIDLPIDIDRGKKGKVVIHKNGKESLTEYQVIEQFKGYTLLKVIPRTGRTHQIRIHLQAIGHPLMIDPLYGNSEPIFLSSLKRNYRFKSDQDERPLIDRLTLHAAEICFAHPATGEKSRLSAPLPKDMKILLNMLAKYRGVRKD